MKILKTKLAKKIMTAVGLYGGLFIFFMLTDPQKLSIGWLLLPFLWIFVALFWTFKSLIISIRRRRKSNKNNTLAAILAGLPTLILLLDSIDQLTVRDVLLIFILGVVGLFYVSKLNFKS